MDIIIPIKIKLKFKLICKIKIKKEITKQQEKIDPIAPEIVLLGLIFVSFRPLKIFPKIYPPISENIHPNKIINIIIFI